MSPQDNVLLTCLSILGMSIRLLTITLIFSLFSAGCSDPPESQIKARFTVFPPEGDTGTLFRFDASSTLNATQDLWRLKVRWDWEDNGVWDTDYSIDKTATRRFHSLGSKNIRLQVLDITGSTDTISGIVRVSELIKDSLIVDPRDGQSYTVIKINHIWWMTQDLAYGKIIPNHSAPSDNGIAERWIFPDSSLATNLRQGFYTEREVTDYYRNPSEGICPPGWRMPTAVDCNNFNNFFWWNLGEIIHADSLTYRFNMGHPGYFYQGLGRFDQPDWSTYYWVLYSAGNYTDAVLGGLGFHPTYWNQDYDDWWRLRLGDNFDRQFLGFALRCVKSDR